MPLWQGAEKQSGRRSTPMNTDNANPSSLFPQSALIGVHPWPPTFWTFSSVCQTSRSRSLADFNLSDKIGFEPSNTRAADVVLNPLLRPSALFILAFSPMMNLSMTPRDDLDPLAPQREAAMFYGLFLRGHSAETLRRDIDVPKPVLDKWLNRQRYETGFRDALRRVYQYRKQVLAIFDELVLNEKNRPPFVQ
jgi:hypothetical protein